MSKVLVLGANGFIGSHLVDSLIDAGHTVRAFDRFSSDDILFKKSDDIEIFAGDYLNRDDLSRALEGIEYVFHFISTTTPASAENDPTIDIDTNIRMSVELFGLCIDAKVKRLIFASTGGAIYGEKNDDTPHKEDDLPLPVSPYAIGKLTIEHYLRYFRVKNGLDSVVFRISNPYGERQPFHRKQGVIPIFLENMYRNKPVTVLGDGSMIRDYIYVKDVSNAIAKVFDKEFQHDTYNLGSGGGKSINELLETISKAVGKDPVINYAEAPATFLPKVVLNVSLFSDEFGEAGQTSLHDGIVATYKYIKDEIDREIQ
jgi:UDP-glucose 4-epimerase